MSSAVVEPLERRRLCSVEVHLLATLGSTVDVRRAETGIAVDPATGTLYGTDHTLFADTPGEVFAVPAGGGAESTLAAFPAGFAGDGTTVNVPVGRLVRDAAGDLFGLTSDNIGAGAVGVLWELPAGSATPVVLHRFANPYSPASLSADAAGNLYGSAATIGGGAPSGNVWWEYPADGSGFKQLTATRGEAPYTVAADAAGDLFGVAATGGSAFDGSGEQYSSHLVELSAAAVAAAAAAPGQPATPVALTAERVGDPPVGLTFDSAGDVYAASDDAVLRWRPGDGDWTTLGSLTASADLSIVSDPTVTAAGDLFVVADQSNQGSDGQAAVLAVRAGTTGLARVADLPNRAWDADGGQLVADAAGTLYGVIVGDQTTTVYALTGRPDVTPPINSSPLVPVVARSTVPAATVAAAKGTVTVTLDNTGSAAVKGPATVTLYAIPVGEAFTAGTLVGSARRAGPVAAGRSAAVAVPVRRVDLSAGSYTLVPVVTDADGGVSTAATGPTVAVAAPYVSLAATVGAVRPTSVFLGQPLSFTLTITDDGNVDATGPATLAVYLSADGRPLAFPVTTVTKRLTVRPAKTVAVRLTVKVPTTAVLGNSYPLVVLTQGASTATAAATTAVAIG